jgi:hypothetical protein
MTGDRRVLDDRVTVVEHEAAAQTGRHRGEGEDERQERAAAHGR